MNEIICIGNTSYDITAYLDTYPVENDKYMTSDFNECGGGPAANASFLIAKWGGKSVFIGLVGTDLYGLSIEESLKEGGVDTEWLLKDPEIKTPLSIITVNSENGSRTLINRNKLDQIKNPDNINFTGYSPSVLLFDGYELAASLKAISLFPEALSVLDAGSLRNETEILAGKVDYLVCSEKFAQSYTGIKNLTEGENYIRAFEKLENLNRKNTVITIGEKGMIFRDGNFIRIMPSFKVEAVDTTGAGDIFHGAFAWGLSKKMELKENLKFSSAAAAMSTCRRGGMTSIPHLDEVRKFLKYS